jgi:sirohydrochlorin ferrochelatase
MLEAKDTAILLIAHGSQNPAANADAHYFVDQIRHLGQYAQVDAAFLELAEPNIDVGATRCLSEGARRLVLVPYFLSAGVHVRCDLTAARQRLAERYPECEIVLAEPIGRHPLLLNVLQDRIKETA